MKNALWYWAKVALVLLPWGVLAAVLKLHFGICLAGGLLSVWAIVGNIPEIEAK